MSPKSEGATKATPVDIPHDMEKEQIDHEEKSVGVADAGEIENKGTILDPLEALGDPDWREKQKKVVRTLDMTLLPMLWILYLFNYLDRTNIAQARLNSFEEDLGLVGNQFNIAVSVLTAGYVLHQPLIIATG